MPNILLFQYLVYSRHSISVHKVYSSCHNLTLMCVFFLKNLTIVRRLVSLRSVVNLTGFCLAQIT